MTDNMPRQLHMAPFNPRRRVGAHCWTGAKHVMPGAPRKRVNVEERMPSLASGGDSALMRRMQEMPRKEDGV